VIDEDGALAHAGQRAPISIGGVAVDDRAQIVVVADTAADDLGALGGFGRRGRTLALVLRDPVLGFFWRAVVDRDLVAGLYEMARHRKAHDAESQERKFRHCRFAPARLP
jgi:hypothetical protein